MSKPERLRLVAYAHASREHMFAIGEKAGLKGEALDFFSYAANEVELFLDVDPKTGRASTYAVDGIALSDVRVPKPTGEPAVPRLRRRAGQGETLTTKEWATLIRADGLAWRIHKFGMPWPFVGDIELPENVIADMAAIVSEAKS